MAPFLEIPLTQNKIALVSPQDYERLIQYKWFAAKQNGGYVYAVARCKELGRLSMHRFLLCPPPGMVVDHIDGDCLNNTRENLRLASVIENGYNRRVKRGSKTGYKGVTIEEGRFRARITVNKKLINLGSFSTVELAHAAYIEAAREYHKDFMRPS